MGHILDILFFRAIGVGLLYHETVLTEVADKWLIAAGVCMFFMPDWIRGKNSALLQGVLAIVRKLGQ